MLSLSKHCRRGRASIVFLFGAAGGECAESKDCDGGRCDFLERFHCLASSSFRPTSRNLLKIPFLFIIYLNSPQLTITYLLWLVMPFRHRWTSVPRLAGSGYILGAVIVASLVASLLKPSLATRVLSPRGHQRILSILYGVTDLFVSWHFSEIFTIVSKTAISFRSFKPKDVTKAPNKFNKLDKKVYFLSNTMHLLNKKAIFMGKGRFILWR